MGQPLVHGGDDVRHPLTARVERRAPGSRFDGLGRVTGQGGGHHLPRAVAPARDAGVGGEHDGAHDAVGERLPVAVAVVGDTRQGAVAVRLVADERDALVDPCAEGRASQRNSSASRLEGLGDGLAPGQPVAGMVDLVEDHERAAGVLGATAVHSRSHRHLGVGRDVADDVGPQSVRVGERRVQQDAGGERRLRPLGAQVVGRSDHDDPVDLTPLEQLGGQAQREGRLAGARRRGDQEVATGRVAVGLQRFDLPGAQPTTGRRDGRGGRCRHCCSRGQGGSTAATKSISISTDRRMGTSRSA